MLQFGVKIIIVAFVIYSTNCFNFSPKPNMIFQEPKLMTFMPKVRSSYFGFTLNLRKSSIIIGAPRAQSTLESQREINETGAIYKCSLNGTCVQYIFNKYGNIQVENNGYTHESEKKDYQWLGASMDGGIRDEDKLVVCAPRLIADMPNDYYLHGICFWTADTLSNQPQNVRRIAPLRLQSHQVLDFDDARNRSVYYMFGEQGISAHVTDNNEEILIGAPGIYNWKGSLIRYYGKSGNNDISISQRDVSRQRVARQSGPVYTFQVPNPVLWQQESDSYFGYSVSSGYFDSTQLEKILYLATAPKADEQSGEAYIFDIAKMGFTEYTIKKYHTFHGNQFGEYFGYAVLAEDLNGDRLTDVIITAPQFSSVDNVEQGAVYVNLNKGNFNFELQTKIISPISGKGRFGSSISRLGDINRDGYNDIAIGAPFADNGAVFIYLGGPNGLRELHVQRLAPAPSTTLCGPQMFGHGLSRGSDIDNNGFNDFAIGAPNAESVYMYRAYPVVKIETAIKFESREIKPDQSKLQVQICYMFSTMSTKIQTQDLAITLSVDPIVKRVTFKETKLDNLAFNATATTTEECRSLEATVRVSTADIFQPIELEMHYELVNGVPESEEFCDKCAAVDPADPKVRIGKIAFSTGCKSNICIADLKVESIGLQSAYILGSSKTMVVSYHISISGETAYLPQINISSSSNMPFAKILSVCTQHEHVLLCNLNQGQPMPVGSQQNITIVYDVSRLAGTSLTLTVVVFSTGDELSPSNNVAKDTIVLQEYTEIEAIGKPQTPYISLEKVLNATEVIYNYEIKSNGPSRIQEVEVEIEIPITYKSFEATARSPIVDINNIIVQGFYDQQQIDAEFYQNSIMLLLNPAEISSSSRGTLEIRNASRFAYKTVIFESLAGEDNYAEKSYPFHERRMRRDTKEVAFKNNGHNANQKNSHYTPNEDLVGTLPVNRTILFSCIDPNTTICVRAVLRVNNFAPDMPATITLKYHVDLSEVNQILIEPWEFFVIAPMLNIVRVGDIDGESTNIIQKMEYSVILKHQLYSTPIRVIILAIMGGLILLAGLTYGMHKAGFFRRKKKEEMAELVQQQKQVAKCPEDQNSELFKG